MRKRRSLILRLIWLSLLLTGCVGDEIVKVANEEWLRLWAASVSPEFFVNLPAVGMCLGFIMLVIGVFAILGLVKWVRDRENPPLGLFALIFVLAGSPFYLMILKGVGDYVTAQTPYSLTWIFSQMGWGWPPGDLNINTLMTAAGLTVALPLLSLGWEIFVVTPSTFGAITAAAITRSKIPLWIGGSMVLGWLVTRPVHYIVVAIIGINRPDGAIGTIVATAVALNQWYFWGTLILLGILWIGFPAVVTIVLLVVWIVGRFRSRKAGGGGKRSGALVAGLPGGEGGGENGEGNGSKESENFDRADKPRSKGKGEKGPGSESKGESHEEANGLGKSDKKPGTRRERGSHGAGETETGKGFGGGATGQLTRVTGKGSTKTVGGKKLVKWHNPDTGSDEWYAADVDPNNLEPAGDTRGNATVRSSSVQAEKAAGEGGGGEDRDNLRSAGHSEGNESDSGGSNNLAGGEARMVSHQPETHQNPGTEETPERGHNLDAAVRREENASGKGENLSAAETHAESGRKPKGERSGSEQAEEQNLDEATARQDGSHNDNLDTVTPTPAEQLPVKAETSDSEETSGIGRSDPERVNKAVRQRTAGEETDLTSHNI